MASDNKSKKEMPSKSLMRVCKSSFYSNTAKGLKLDLQAAAQAYLPQYHPSSRNTNISPKIGTSNIETKKAIFLSHEGQNKIFAHNLFDELQNRNLTTFFDQDIESLPPAERFPDKIIEGLRGCKLVVFLLSESFISKKWPMIELVEAYRHFLKTKSPLLLPLFYNLSVSDIDEKKNKEGWNKWSTAWHNMAGTFSTSSNENITINPEDCEEALKFITKQNGISKGSLSEHQFMKAVADRICESGHVTPDIWGTNDRLHHQNLSKVVDDQFQHIDKGPKLLGMWGEKNSGKSSLANALCAYYFENFNGIVQCVELAVGCENILKEVKNILHTLTNADWRLLDSITSLDQAINYLKSRIKGKRFFLAIDNIPLNQRCRDAIRDLWVAISDCADSCVLLTARDQQLLESFLKECGCSTQPIQVPQLQEQEAIDLLVSFATSSRKEWGDYDDNEKNAIQSLCKSSPIYDMSSENFSPGEAKSTGLLIRASTEETAKDPLQWQTIHKARLRSGDLDQLFSQSIQRTLERAFRDKAKVQQSLQLIIDAALYEKAMGPTLNGIWRWLGIIHDITRTSVRRKFEEFKAHKLIDWAEDDEKDDAETLDVSAVFDWPTFMFPKFAKAEAREKPNKWRWFYYDGHAPEQTPESTEPENFEKLALVRGDFKDVAEVVSLRRCVAVAALMMSRCDEVQRLNVSTMKQLQALEIENCKSLRKIKGVEEAKQLERLYVNCAPSCVNGLLNFSMLRNLRSVRLINTGMKKPPKISGCPALRELYIERNGKLRSLPTLGGDLTSLSHISFADNPKVTTLPDLSPLAASLTHLSVRNCAALANIKTLDSLTSLQCLNISSCKNLRQPLPDLSNLKHQSSKLEISARRLDPRTIEEWKNKGGPDQDALGSTDVINSEYDSDG